MNKWLHIIGIGEDGYEALGAGAKQALKSADVIIGGDRHHGLAPELNCERIHWPSPFRAMVDEIGSMSHRQVAVLVTGDPTWFSAGAYLARKFPDECVIYPQLSAFQLAAARMGWSLADVETLTIHGRPAEQIVPRFSHGQRLLVLTQDGTSPKSVADLLVANGFGPSKMTVLGALGGDRETRMDGHASDWVAAAPDFHCLAIECVAETGTQPLPLTGLPDDAFHHDGQITKREIRALTVASLSPRRGAVLWDIGAGSGSVGIEFMRSARDAMCYAIERDETRVGFIGRNAETLGVPRLKIVHAGAHEGIADLPQPDAIFIGGGLSMDLVDKCVGTLKPFGTIVSNAVTLESETLLTECQGKYGGALSRISVSRAQPVGRLRGWKPMMPVTQWVLRK